MNAFAPIRSPLPCALLVAALAGACASALAAEGLERAKQRGELRAGIRYVLPEYTYAYGAVSPHDGCFDSIDALED